MNRDLELDALRLLSGTGAISRRALATFLGAHYSVLCDALRRQLGHGHVIELRAPGTRALVQITRAGRAWLAQLPGVHRRGRRPSRRVASARTTPIEHERPSTGLSREERDEIATRRR